MNLGDALDAPEAATRAQRLATIGAPPPVFVDPGLLVKALGDDDPSVRKEAVRLCERWRDAPVVFTALERALRDEESLSRRSSAMDAYGMLGAQAAAPLARLYESDKPGLRRIAVDALGLTRAREAVPHLLKATKDPVPSIRTAALEGLVKIGAPEAPQALAEVIGDKREPASVVLAALLGMVGLGDAVAPELLLRHLDDALTAPPALRLLGRAGQAEPLVKVLASSTGSRQRAAVVGLMEALERDPKNARALSMIGAGELAAALRRHVEQGDAAVAAAALFVAAHAGLVDLFVATAARRDRQLLASAAHKAAAVLATSVPGAADVLATAAEQDKDAPGHELLAELADAVRRRRAANIERRAPSPLAPRSSTAKLSDLLLLRLAHIFEREAGLLIQLDARERIEARLVPRVEACGVPSFEDYVSLLDAQTGERGDGRRELMKALELVTVHETYFFRERAQLDAFKLEVLPALSQASQRRPGERKLRVWSAGCSSGEEAWTIAMMLTAAGLPTPFEVVGTDLSETSIAQARSAKYSPKSFRGDIDPDTRRRSFVYELGGVSVHPSLRADVTFQVVNLKDQDAVQRLGRFDAIFCRNVLIYMSKEARADVVASFYERLVPGGALFLGHSESLLHVDTAFRLLPLTRELCWTRPEVGAAFREAKKP